MRQANTSVSIELLGTSTSVRRESRKTLRKLRRKLMSEIVDASKSHRLINKPPILFEKTQKIIEQIEDELNSTFLTYWTSTNGNVCQSDVAGLQEVLQKIGNTSEIVLFLKSEGGSGQASLRIVHLLRH